MDLRANTYLQWCAFLVTSGAYLLYILHFAVNSLFGDDFRIIPWVHNALQGHVPYQLMWENYSAHRMFFINLILVANGTWNHYDTTFVVYLGASMLIIAYAILLRTIRSNAAKPNSALLTLLIGVIIFSPVSYESALWDFCLEWNLTVLCFSVVIWCLSKTLLTKTLFLLLLTSSVIASYSSLQGLVILPLVLACLVWRWRLGGISAKWIYLYVTAGLIIIYFYFGNGSFGPGNNASTSFALHNPLWVMKFFVALIGAVVPFGASFLLLDQAVGCLLIILTGFVLYNDLRDTRSARTIPLPSILIGFSLLSDIQIALGRSWGGPAVALTSRYSLPNLILLIGLAVFFYSPSQKQLKPLRLAKRVTHLTVLTGILAILIAAQVSFSSIVSFNAAERFSQNRVYGAQAVINYDGSNPDMFKLTCAYVNCFVDWPIDVYAAYSKQDGLSEFYPTSLYDHYRQLGLPPLPSP